MAEDNQEEVLEEHRRIQQLLGRVDAAVREATPGSGWSLELAGMLDEVVRLLKAHFSGEAESSFFRQMLETAPRLSPQINKLVLEHSGILKAFTEGAKLAKELDPADRVQCKDLRRKVQLALATLKRHEAEENEMIMQAYWEDVGVAD